MTIDDSHFDRIAAAVQAGDLQTLERLRSEDVAAGRLDEVVQGLEDRLADANWQVGMYEGFLEQARREHRALRDEAGDLDDE